MAHATSLLVILSLLDGLAGFLHYLPIVQGPGCPQMNGYCICDHELRLQCIDMGIDTLGFLQDNLANDSFVLLSLSYNNITAVLNDDLPFYLLTNLVSLHLDHNAVSEVEPQAFQDLPVLKAINLSFNNISLIHVDTFRNNTKLKELFLSHNHLTNVEFVRKITNLQYLFLDNNNISILINKTFSSTQSSELYLINLRHNGLETIEVKAFYGLTKLQFLLLEGNFLTILHSGTFRFASSLRYLYMEENNLTDLSLSHNTINLREGFFSNNIISVLTNDIFSGSSIVHLEELNLENNTISTIKHRAFQRLQLLWKLNLTGNNITFVHPDTFQNTTSLSILDLSRNRITNIEFVRNIPSLEYLLISNNLIPALSNETFCCIGGVSDLFTIDLSNNIITTVDQRAFQCLRDLEFLDLSQNNITFLNPDVFQNTTELLELNLNSNNIIKLDAFQNIPNLEVLNLSNNTIQNLLNQTFSNTNSSHLKRIYLAKNEITTVEKLAFEGISELQVLDLSRNNISFMYPNTIPYIQSYYAI